MLLIIGTILGMLTSIYLHYLIYKFEIFSKWRVKYKFVYYNPKSNEISSTKQSDEYFKLRFSIDILSARISLKFLTYVKEDNIIYLNKTFNYNSFDYSFSNKNTWNTEYNNENFIEFIDDIRLENNYYCSLSEISNQSNMKILLNLFNIMYA